jgi:hypothetical protein
VLDFDVDGNILAGGTKHQDCFILPFSRLLVKDEIKKGSFTMTLGLGTAHAAANAVAHRITIMDSSGSDGYLVNSPAGEYGILFAKNVATPSADTELIQPAAGVGIPVGLLYYQAGICVLTASVFGRSASSHGLLSASCVMTSDTTYIEADLKAKTIQVNADNLRHRIIDITFNNTTELNSTIYFCRAHHNEFNYSTNPTYLTGSKIRVKTNSSDNPVSYITTIGMYNDNNELMAVSKLSEPLKKTPDVEFTLRVRLDY